MRINRDECWLYAGYVSDRGYGKLRVDGRNLSAHRIMYEVVKGEIPEGLVIDHICNVTQCVNPDHLRAVTSKFNILIGKGAGAVNKLKTHCKNGHPLNSENTTITKRGYRRCMPCTYTYNKENRKKNYYPGKYSEPNRRRRERLKQRQLA